MILIKKWKTTLTTLIILAGILAVYWFTMGPTSTNGDYKAAVDKLTTEIADYKAHHDGSLPVSGANMTLATPAGDYFIIDICELMSYVPDGFTSVEGESNDNCDAGDCQCHADASYVWLCDSYGKVLSKCVGDHCKASDADGYQGIWP